MGVVEHCTQEARQLLLHSPQLLLYNPQQALAYALLQVQVGGLVWSRCSEYMK